MKLGRILAALMVCLCGTSYMETADAFFVIGRTPTSTNNPMWVQKHIMAGLVGRTDQYSHATTGMNEAGTRKPPAPSPVGYGSRAYPNKRTMSATTLKDTFDEVEDLPAITPDENHHDRRCKQHPTYNDDNTDKKSGWENGAQPARDSSLGKSTTIPYSYNKHGIYETMDISNEPIWEEINPLLSPGGSHGVLGDAAGL